MTKRISIVTPTYNEAENVAECRRRVLALFEGGPLAGYDHEHLFCDNASKDETATLLRAMAAGDSRVKVILNARNFGPFRSLFNGVIATEGDATLVFLPADLQDPPEILPQMVALWEAGYEVVYGIRKQREENFLMVLVRKAYYRLINRFSEIDIPVDAGEFQLVDRKVIQALRRFEDYYPYVRGMIASCGFRATGVAYTWVKRERGFSKNRLYHLMDQGLNGIISTTTVPLRLAMLGGFVLAGLSIANALFQLVLNVIYYKQIAPPGIPTLIVAIFFFSGIQLFFMGLLGEYISAIHAQVRRPVAVIERERINFEATKGVGLGV